MTEQPIQTTDELHCSKYTQNGHENQRIDVDKAQRGIRLVLESIGADPDRDTLEETWQRRVPETLATLTRGMHEEAKPELRTFDTDIESLIVKTGIPVHSLCEHHLLPYTGTARIAYRPNGAAVGLSKLSRYVRWQSRRIGIQEQLTSDIAIGLADEIGTDLVMVQLSATHMCEAMRGVETATETETQAVIGQPTEAEQRRFRKAGTGGTNR